METSKEIQNKSKDIWDKLPAISAFMASVLIPIVVLLAGNSFAERMKVSDASLRYTEISLSILRSEPSADTESLREWAIEVLSKHSAVPLSANAQAELRKRRVQGWYEPGNTNVPVNYENLENTKFPDAATYRGIHSVRPAASSASK